MALRNSPLPFVQLQEIVIKRKPEQGKVCVWRVVERWGRRRPLLAALLSLLLCRRVRARLCCDHMAADGGTAPSSTTPTAVK